MTTLENEDAAASQPGVSAPRAEPSKLLLTTLAAATGALAANLYYAQPLIASIAPEIGIGPGLAGTVVSVTQIGYGVGLFFLVSLTDLVESKRLVLLALAVTTLALVGEAVSGAAPLFFLSALVVGLASTGAQVLVPFASHLAPPESRGRIVGNVMAGLLTGILLARPAALFIASAFGWRAVFWASAALMLVIAALLMRIMPPYRPRGGMSYGEILRSMALLFRDIPVLRRRAAYQVLLFGAFNVFWTAAPLMLAERFGLSQQGIALFALAGAGGAFAAPVAGRLGDRGHAQIGTAVAAAVVGLSFLATIWTVSAGWLAVLVVVAVLLDAAAQGNQIFSQRILFSLPAEIRGRINAAYMTVMFLGGAAGSTLGAAAYHWGGWTTTALLGALMGALALVLFATEYAGRRVG
ncbi:MAG TPA: MFS transporter [Devosiaceae bacterium]|nr:MFS transporter [Devosiaceae bacterium]